MPLFKCEGCGCVENTAVSNYNSRDLPIWPEEFLGKKLCSECGPPTYASGKPSKYGKWHGRWPKESADGYVLDQYGFLVMPEGFDEKD